MSGQYPQQSVIVSDTAVKSDEPYDIIQSNIEFLNAQFEKHLTHEEVSQHSLQSYYVDYFLAQLNNGGFSQFVYNSRWGDCIHHTIDGLAAMGAVKHLDLFAKATQLIKERLGAQRLQKFLSSEYFGDNEEHDILNELNSKFFALSNTEDLIELNAQWLRGLNDLVVLSESDIAQEIQRRAKAIPDREARISAARNAEPRYMKLIRALCIAAGHELDRITTGDPTREYQGQRTMAWHFLTDRGHFHMLDIDGKALMFEGRTDNIVCEIEAPEEFGP